jgi:hypothetical protein
VVRTIVTEPQEVELTAEEAGAEDKKIEDDIVVPADASDKDAVVSETPPATTNVVSFEAPWRLEAVATATTKALHAALAVALRTMERFCSDTKAAA